MGGSSLGVSHEFAATVRILAAAAAWTPRMAPHLAVGRMPQSSACRHLSRHLASLKTSGEGQQDGSCMCYDLLVKGSQGVSILGYSWYPLT